MGGELPLHLQKMKMRILKGITKISFLESRYGISDFQQTENIRNGNNATIYPESNLYYSDAFMGKLKSIIFLRLGATLGLLIDDLSRHAAEEPTADYCYNAYSDYFKSLETESGEKEVQSICSSNRTQGIIEEHFFS